jgi:hypothetical protein
MKKQKTESAAYTQPRIFQKSEKPLHRKEKLSKAMKENSFGKFPLVLQLSFASGSSSDVPQKC